MTDGTESNGVEMMDTALNKLKDLHYSGNKNLSLQLVNTVAENLDITSPAGRKVRHASNTVVWSFET
jgi:hypothetical protein